jgi:hypothetical protein
MASVDNIRNGLINKILTIRNREFLLALDNLIASSTTAETEVAKLTAEQKLMLEMSEDDIRHGRVSTQFDLRKKTSEWLKNQKPEP